MSPLSSPEAGFWGVAGGYALVWRRTFRFWGYKVVGITVGMTGFFWLYFQVLQHPGYPVSEMPLLAVDGWVPFAPFWLGPYVSLWIYVLLPPILLTELRDLRSYAAASAVLSGTGLTLFYFWPTRLPPLDIPWEDHPSIRFLKAVDASGNACPSLHVAFAVFTAIWLERLGRRLRSGTGVRVVLWCWCAAIVVSTLGTKQHVALDAIAGIALAGAVAWVQLKLLISSQLNGIAKPAPVARS